MGWVWNILLSHSNEELWVDGEDEPRSACEPLERINEWLPAGKLVSLTGPTYADEAGHGLDANLFGGGYKHLDIERFVKVVEAQKWKDRAGVQLWVKGAQEGMGDEPFSPIKLWRRSPKGIKAAKRSPSRTPKHRTKSGNLGGRHNIDLQPTAATKSARRRG